MTPFVLRVSNAEYEALTQMGCFANERVELADGPIVHMIFCEEPHTRGAAKTIRALIFTLPEELFVRPWHPINAG